MQFLRTLFWVVAAVIAVIFSTRNWTTVTVNLWGGLAADAKLPVLLGAAFLLGLLPPLILYRATRWRLRRRLATAERSLGEARAADVAVPAAIEPAAPAIAPPTASATASASASTLP